MLQRYVHFWCEKEIKRKETVVCAEADIKRLDDVLWAIIRTTSGAKSIAEISAQD